MKKIQITLILVIVVAVLGFLTWGGFKLGWFQREALSIEKTANVVEEVRKIGEFTTACYYEEMAIKDSYEESGHFLGIKKTTHNEILLIGRGRARAGFDLTKLQEGDLKAYGDTLEIVLPKPEIFDITMNPSDFTTEYEKGTWDHELTKPVKERAKANLEKNAIDSGILKKAEDNGLKRLEALFQTFGYNAVLITVGQPSEKETE